MKQRAVKLEVDRLHWSQYDVWNSREGGPKYDYIKFQADVPAEAWEPCVVPLVTHHGTPASRFLFHDDFRDRIRDRLGGFVGVIVDTNKKYEKEYEVYKYSDALANRAQALMFVDERKSALDRMKKLLARTG